MNRTPVLEARDLRVRRGGTEVLAIDSFILHENETLALIGPNGAGKSSLMLTLAGLLEPASGHLLFRSEQFPTGSGATGYRRRIAMVFQEPLLFDTTVFGNVAAGLKIRGVPPGEIRERVDATLQRFRIAHLAGRSARKLSGGEAQRTSLARAFATRPEVIILDEPFAALDPPTRQLLTDDLEQVLREWGTAAILSTHDQGEALRLADRMMVMNNGAIIQSGPPSEVMNRPATEFVASFVGMENIFTGTTTTTIGGLLYLEVAGTHLEVMGDGVTGEDVVFCIRPEHVVLSVGTPESHTSARNVFPGKVIRIVPQGLYQKLYLECGFTLVAAVTNQSLQELRLAPGSPVVASFKATAVHLFRSG